MPNYSKVYSKNSIKRARQLRAQSTQAEAKLWSILRGNKLGVHFRRQVLIGPYIADFASSKKKLIVELDGSQHLSTKGLADDTQRTEYLEGEGFRVLRFNNLEVLKNPREVAEAIKNNISKPER